MRRQAARSSTAPSRSSRAADGFHDLSAFFHVWGLPAWRDVLAGGGVCRGLCAGREGEVERRALVDGDRCPDHAVVAMNGPDYGRQADSVARELALAVKPVKWAKQPFGVRHVKAGAVVGHEVHGHAVLLDRPEANPRALGLGGELECVVEQVLQHGLHEPGIRLGDQPILDLDLDPPVGLGGVSSAMTSPATALMSTGARAKGCRDRRESCRISSISLPIRDRAGAYPLEIVTALLAELLGVVVEQRLAEPVDSP